MAHNFDIPIAFSYQPERVKWEPCFYALTESESFAELDTIAVPQSLRFPLPKLDLPILERLPVPAHSLLHLYRGNGILTYLRSSDTIYRTFTPEVVASLQAVAELEKAGGAIPESMSQLLVVFERKDSKPRESDPWKMRDEFMRLDESNASLLAFLNRWGVWDIDGPLFTDAARGTPLRMQPFCVLPSLVWKRRRAFKEGMLGSAEAWLTEDAALGTTHRRSRFPFLGITDRTCAKAIETTITFDHMRNVKSRICARPDCGNIFTVESGHGKIYCEQYCGHLVSIRRKRAATKRAKKSAKRKGVGNVNI